SRRELQSRGTRGYGGRSRTHWRATQARANRGYQDALDRSRLRQARVLEQHDLPRAERRRLDRSLRCFRRGDGLLSGKAVLANDAQTGRARRQSQTLAESRDSDNPDAHRPRPDRTALYDDGAAATPARHGRLAGAGDRNRELTVSNALNSCQLRRTRGRRLAARREGAAHAARRDAPETGWRGAPRTGRSTAGALAARRLRAGGAGTGYRADGSGESPVG